MIRDITIGQYYPAESPIHRLDPRVKIVCTLLFLVSLFIQNSLLGYVAATIFLGCVIHLSCALYFRGFIFVRPSPPL